MSTWTIVVNDALVIFFWEVIRRTTGWFSWAVLFVGTLVLYFWAIELTKLALDLV